MSVTDSISCMLTLALAMGAHRELRHGVLARGTGRCVRIDASLHCVMAVDMIAMTWVGPTPGIWREIHVGFFAGAALWLLLSASARAGGRAPSAVLDALPSTAGMAAMIWMSAGSPCPEHSGTATDSAAHPGQAHVLHSAGTALLALCLLVCALYSLTRDLPGLRRTQSPAPPAGVKDVYGRFAEGTTRLATATMLLMHS